MNADVLWLDTAVSDLEKLTPGVAARVVARVDWLAENLDSVRLQALHGSFAGLFKLRVGDLRVVFEVDMSASVVTVHFVRHRSEVYE